MAATEEARFALAGKLEEVLGHEDAMTLLESLPPARDRVATGQDVAQLDGRLDRVEDRILSLEQEVRHLGRTMTLGLVGATATLGGVVIAAAQLS